MPVLPGPRRSRPSTNPRSRRVARRRAGDAALPRRGELHLAAVAQRDRRTTYDGRPPRGRPCATTVPYAAAARVAAPRPRWQARRAPTCSCSPTTVLRRRPGTALVAATHSPAAAYPHRRGAGRSCSTAQTAGNPGSNEPGPKSMPGWLLTSRSRDAVKAPAAAGPRLGGDDFGHLRRVLTPM